MNNERYLNMSICFSGTFLIYLQFLPRQYIFNQQRFRAGLQQMPCHRQCFYVARKHMETLYKYISSPDFINSLTFEYLETYSFQRGTKFEEDQKLIKPEFENLKVRKEKQNDLTTVEEERFAELNELLGFTQYLINDKGQFHPSSRKTNTFLLKDPKIETIKNILRMKINDIPRWLCAPFYRDAIIFRNKSNEIVSVVNICLSCLYMETEMFNYINADYESYDLFKSFFIDIGHEVEDPTHFILDDINKLKAKYYKSKPS